MAARMHAYSWQQFAVILIALATCLLLVEAFAGATTERAKFVSSEVYFSDVSPRGMQILPASCSSSPSSYHGNLTATSDGKGYTSSSGQTEYGATKAFGFQSYYVCVTNSSGASYFVPANTAAELQSFINKGSSIPGVQIWGSGGEHG